jgi:Tol biopolymer transport system component
MKLSFRLSILVLCFFVTTTAFSQALRGITAEDYFAFEFLSDPHISPNGKLVAYVVTKVDRTQNRRNSSIWMVATDGTRAPWQFTTSPQSVSSPRWSPDGRSLAFLSARPETAGTGAAAGVGNTETPKSQVYLLSMAGGEAQRITNLKNGATSFQWSPDGNRLVVVSRTGPSDFRPAGKDRSDVRHYKNSSYKFNDTGWFDDKKSHLWIVNVKSGSMNQVTVGEDWNDSDPQWSPDGTRIAFVSNRTGKEYEGNRNSDIWVIFPDGTKLTQISDHEESDVSPRWSPDGRMIAFIGELKDGDHPKVWLAPVTGGKAASVLAAEGLDFPTPEWSEDGKSIYF